MDGGPMQALRMLGSQLPSIAGTAVKHTLGQTPNSSKWDFRTAMTVEILRIFMGGRRRGTGEPMSIAKVQKMGARNPEVKGNQWVANDTFARPPEDDAREVIYKAIEALNPSGNELVYNKPEMADIQVEWTGYRSGAKKDERLPADKSERERYDALMAEPGRKSKLTLLYFHGGAYYMGDPGTHRPLTTRLAKESGGRVCSVRYRLTPQTSFPGQLLDALLSYLALLHPPPGSLHAAVPASDIVLGGDSAGGNLCFALVQLLLQLHRSAEPGTVPTVAFHGAQVPVPLPAGACANSGWFDVARAALPSSTANIEWDYLPPSPGPNETPNLAHDEIWPTDPPRGDFLVDLAMLDHPLVSPIVATSWTTTTSGEGGASIPLWFSCGQEMLADEDGIVAARAANQGVPVQWEKYEAMPHCFNMLLSTLPQANRCNKSWGDYCRRAVEEPDKLVTNGVFVKAGKTISEEQVDVTTVGAVPFDEVVRLLKETKERRIQVYEKELKKGNKTPAISSKV